MGSSIQYPNCETPSDSGGFPHPHLPPGGEGVHSTPQHKQQHLGRETGKGAPTLHPGGEAVPINTSTQKVESPHPTLPPWWGGSSHTRPSISKPGGGREGRTRKEEKKGQ